MAERFRRFRPHPALRATLSRRERDSLLNCFSFGNTPMKPAPTTLLPPLHRLAVRGFRREFGEFDADAVRVGDVR